MNERRFFDVELSIEERSEGDAKIPVLVGYAAVFGKRSVDLGGFTEEVAPGAFSDTIRSEDIAALVDHDPSLIIGRTSAGTLKLSEDSKGLRFEAKLPDTTAGRDIRESVSRGDVKGASFGFRTISDAWRMEEGKPHRTLTKAKLRDVGPVTFPAYPDTQVGMRSEVEGCDIALRSLADWKDSQEANALAESQRAKRFSQIQRQAEASVR